MTTQDEIAPKKRGRPRVPTEQLSRHSYAFYRRQSEAIEKRLDTLSAAFEALSQRLAAVEALLREGR
jgi:hypothetical protein